MNEKFNHFCQQMKFRIFRLQSFTSSRQFTLELRRFPCKLLLTSVCAYDGRFAFETFEQERAERNPLMLVQIEVLGLC